MKSVLTRIDLKRKAADYKTTQILRSHGFSYDISRTFLTPDTIATLAQMYGEKELESLKRQLACGTLKNISENRTVFHMGLRNEHDTCGLELKKIRNRIKELSDAFQNGRLLGSANKPIRHVVNLGIGGSHLGPYLIKEALRDLSPLSEEVFFISNVDAFEVNEVLAKCPLDETVFIVASKSFTTSETLLNANYIKQKYEEANIGEISNHFYAVTAEVSKAIKWGVSPENILPFWDWVGGRFSLWGPIGLAASMAIGYEHFIELLDGARSVDEHFMSTEIEQNIPCLMAMNTIVNHQFLDKKIEIVTPYSDRLKIFPEYVQQLQMESNGKNVRKNGLPLETEQTCPAIFGGVGTDMQHAFYQWLHQGSPNAAVEFIGFINTEAEAQFRFASLSNLLAQSEALTYGASSEKGALAPYTHYEGGVPNTILMFDEFSAFSLGQMLALYEHKTFVVGVWHGINSFDQWGVQLGKVHAKRILGQLNGEINVEDEPQSYWIDYIKSMNK